MSENIALNRTATANNYVSPYAPSRAVDGSGYPTNRWLSNTVPAWLMIDTGQTYSVNRWVVWQMPQSGWRSPEFLNAAVSLQASMDSQNWSTIDSVSGSQSSSIIDRTFNPAQGRYFRVVVSRGLNTNPQLASIVEFALYAAPASDKLSDLKLSSGTLSPTFDASTFNYSASVGYGTSSITITPTAEDASATITVNGIQVANGQPSPPIPLTAGSPENIVITVTSTTGAKQNYTVAATRQTSTYLSNLVVKKGSLALSLSPTFSSTNLGPYTATVPSPVIFVYPTPEDATANIVVTCNGTELTKTGTNYRVNLKSGDNDIIIKVNSTTGAINNYTLVISKT